MKVANNATVLSSKYTKKAVLFNQSINQSNYFIARPKVDQRAGQLCLPHVRITKTEKNKTNEQISPVNSLEP